MRLLRFRSLITSEALFRGLNFRQEYGQDLDSRSENLNLKSKIYLKTRIDHGSIKFRQTTIVWVQCSHSLLFSLSLSTHCQSWQISLEKLQLASVIDRRIMFCMYNAQNILHSMHCIRIDRRVLSGHEVVNLDNDRSFCLVHRNWSAFPRFSSSTLSLATAFSLSLTLVERTHSTDCNSFEWTLVDRSIDWTIGRKSRTRKQRSWTFVKRVGKRSGRCGLLFALAGSNLFLTLVPSTLWSTHCGLYTNCQTTNPFGLPDLLKSSRILAMQTLYYRGPWVTTVWPTLCGYTF